MGVSSVIEFIAASFNEEVELNTLIAHIYPYVDYINIVDDGSTDNTPELLDQLYLHEDKFNYRIMEHTGLPETVKAAALEMCHDGSWILMCDFDERFAEGVLEAVQAFYNSPEADDYDYVYFTQLEFIDDVAVRMFQKSKLFRKEAITFPLEDIHADDILTGRGLYKEEWQVHHRKSTSKQVTREIEYLFTYKKLLAEGKIDQGRYEYLVKLHHYVRPH